MRPTNVQKVSVFLPFLMVFCSSCVRQAAEPIPTPPSQQGSESSAADEVTGPRVSVAWKTVAATPDANGPRVDLFMVLSGAVVRQIPLGKFHGELLEPSYEGTTDDLLYREWWMGAGEAFYIQRKDATRLSVEQEDVEGDSPRKEILMIDIPENVTVECVDDGGC